MARKPAAKAVTNPFQAYYGSLYRKFVPYGIPSTFDAEFWRKVVKQQPVLGVIQNNLIMHIQSLPWDIRARNSEKADELRENIEYHKDILLKANQGDGWLNYVALLLQDLYTIPFGAITETIRYTDDTLYSIQALDGGTFYPPLEQNKHVAIQYVPMVSQREIYFNKSEATRMYMMPRPSLYERGWGMSPAEKVYLAIELLSRGDKYYANLLLDTPEAGLLDLGDMSKESAEKWLTDFREMFSGIDPFKIPVIYEHTTPAKYLPFNRPPSEISYDAVTTKYAQIACAAHGITIYDIGLSGGQGQSLAGQIRSERMSQSTGYASAKKYITQHINTILPPDLEFWFVDVNDELLVAKGRARSANAVAGRNLIESGALTPKEWRAQLKADGLVTIPLPELPDEAEFDILQQISGQADQLELQKQELEANKQAGKTQGLGGQEGKGLNRRRNLRGGKLETTQGKEPTPASSGGMGEIKSDPSFFQKITDRAHSVIYNNNPRYIRKIVKNALRASWPMIALSRDREDLDVYAVNLILEMFDRESGMEDRETIQASINNIVTDIAQKSADETWYKQNLTDLQADFTQYLEIIRQKQYDLLYEDNIDPAPTAMTVTDDSLPDILQRIDNHLLTTLCKVSLGTVIKYILPDETLRNGDLETIIKNEELLNEIILDIFDEMQEIYFPQLYTQLESIGE